MKNSKKKKGPITLQFNQYFNVYMRKNQIYALYTVKQKLSVYSETPCL